MTREHMAQHCCVWRGLSCEFEHSYQSETVVIYWQLLPHPEQNCRFFFSNLWLHFDNPSCEFWRPATGHLAPGAKRSGHGHHSSSSCHWRGRWVWFTSSAQISPHLGCEMAILQSQVCFSKWWVAAVLVSGQRPSEQLLEAEEQRPERHQHLQAFQLIYIHNARFLS